MDKIPVMKLDSAIYNQVREELTLNSKLRLIFQILDNGFESVSPFSEEEEQMLNELKGLDEQALISLQKEVEDKLSIYIDKF